MFTVTFSAQLMSLSLASNKLYSIELMSSLRKAAPDMVGLDLSDNMVRIP